MAQKKGYIKRTTEQRLRNESLFSEFSRYQYAKDEIDKLNAEIKQKKEEREQKIREREQEYDASMRGDSVSKPVDLGQSVQ